MVVYLARISRGLYRLYARAEAAVPFAIAGSWPALGAIAGSSLRERSGPGGGVLAGGNGAEAEACDGGGVGVRTHLEGAEDLGRQRGLVAEPKDEDAGQDLFGREQE